MREASTAMSVAELPIPSTSTRLPAQHLGLAVVVDVNLLALELVRSREGRFGPARVPVVPVGDEHRAVAMRLALALRVLDGDLPLALDGLDAHHLGAKPDLLPQPEVVDVVVEVAARSESGSDSPDSHPASDRSCRPSTPARC